ncbi:hypothetical protein [Streptomyces sp. NPDC059862]|uniref:hypothetical protein n=1 Tax=unclassified Streptomyces TaxID=2593676 RepID=UPI00363D3143
MRTGRRTSALRALPAAALTALLVGTAAAAVGVPESGAVVASGSTDSLIWG